MQSFGGEWELVMWCGWETTESYQMISSYSRTQRGWLEVFEETYKGLMYVEIAMGRQKVVALVDSGATQNLNGMFIMDET